MKCEDQQLLEKVYEEKITPPPRATAKTYTPLAYKEALSELNNSMEKVHVALERHKEKASKEPDNRGYVGDIEHVRDILDDILEFLGGKK